MTDTVEPRTPLVEVVSAQQLVDPRHPVEQQIAALSNLVAHVIALVERQQVVLEELTSLVRTDR